MGAFEQGQNEMRKCDTKRSWGESTLSRGNSIGKKPGCRNMASPRNRGSLRIGYVSPCRNLF